MIDLQDKVPSSIREIEQEEAVGQEHISWIEQTLGVNVPLWYLNFITDHGCVTATYFQSESFADVLCTFGRPDSGFCQ